MSRCARLVVLLACAKVSPPTPSSTAARSMISTNSATATRIGLQAMQRGGNAIDGAVAAAFALAVAWPEAGNLGGGGFLLVRTREGKTAALDFREVAPEKATADMFLDSEGNPTKDSLEGPRSAGVPGSVAGLFEAHRRYGRRSWSELVSASAQLADEGLVVDEALHRSIADSADRLARDPSSADLFLPKTRAPSVGSRWRNPALARTLQRIARDGPDDFYRGDSANLLTTYMERHGGLISSKDLRTYRAQWREPVRFRYRDATVYSMPPPSSGGLTLALMAGILRNFDLRSLGRGSAKATHLTVESMRRAFAVRNERLGDPDFVAIDRRAFLEETQLERWRNSIATDRASPSSELPTMRPEAAHTTHLSVVDRDGMAVALTTTLNLSFGSAITVPECGFLLNNEMDDFAAAPGRPNVFGLVQGSHNAIAPGKRMLSSMSPTIAVRDDGTLLVTGAAGGPTIISTVFQIVSNVLDHGLSIQEAARSPRFHHQHLPDLIRFEAGAFSQDTMRELETMGHRLVQVERLGNAQTILWTRRGVFAAPETRILGSLALGN